MKAVSFILVILVLAPAYKARPQNFNLSQSGNIQISTIDGVFKCDGMECPSNSVKCSVSMTSTKDLANVETIRKCYDANEVATKEETSLSPNPYPGSQVVNYSEATRTGTMVNQQFHVGDGPNDGNDAFAGVDLMNQEFQDWHKNFVDRMNAFNMNFQQQIQNFHNFQNSQNRFLH
ncbi:hypothetical protein Bhyg_00769 [Pseudolycoriella hygida]|uniref:Uncharacterized protein n=1 Tax=Pseudolycoriella hygida TaxID=35572 RepID=A0A9Q0S674_9DIPT|nr:hypothetical protein Bhyg_00769 [Pseudolycoriella hygida]